MFWFLSINLDSCGEFIFFLFIKYLVIFYKISFRIFEENRFYIIGNVCFFLSVISIKNFLKIKKNFLYCFIDFF